MKRLASIICLGLCASACSAREPEKSINPIAHQATKPAPSATGGELVSIPDATQATLDDVKLGVGNIWDEEYKDASGAAKTGLTAGIWIFIRDDAKKNTTMRAYPGMKFSASKLDLEVKSITDDGITLIVNHHT